MKKSGLQWERNAERGSEPFIEYRLMHDGKCIAMIEAEWMTVRVGPSMTGRQVDRVSGWSATVCDPGMNFDVGTFAVSASRNQAAALRAAKSAILEQI